MGAIVLKPDETVFFPTPYTEDEVHPVVITTSRVVQASDNAKPVEMEVEKITFVGRASKRPLMVPGMSLFVFGIPGVIFGLYLFISVWGMPTFDEQPPPPDTSEWDDPFRVRIEGVLAGGLGLLFCAGGVILIRKKKFFVQVRGGKRNLKLPVDDKMQQQQVMMTLQAAMSSAKQQVKAKEAMAKAQAAAAIPPPAAPPGKGAAPAPGKK